MSLASGGRVGSARAQALSALREAFTPTQPKQSVQLFAGRRRELKRIVSAIEEWKAHVVIYGERGYGKSSLANVVAEIARQGGISVLNCSCSSEITFEEMFRGFLRDIPLPYRGVPGRDGAKADAARAGGHFASLLPAGPFGAMELTEALRHLTDRHVIFRLDEFDRVRDAELTNQLAESIKNLSDVGARVTFLIVGVAEDLDELLGKHPSIQRNVVGIHLSLMSESELVQLVKAGERAAEIVFEDEVRARIVALAQGLPYQAQLLSLHCGQAAVEEGAKRVGPPHLARAIDQVIAHAPAAIERIYERTFMGPNQDQIKAIALAAALSQTDEVGYFAVADVLAAQSGRGGRPIPHDSLQRELQRLAAPGSGRLFKVLEEGSVRRYAFADPLMRAFLRLVAEGT